MRALEFYGDVQYHVTMLAETLMAIVGLAGVHAARAEAPATIRWNDLAVAKYASPLLHAPIKHGAESIGIETTARSAVVIDVTSGAVLYEKDAQVSVPVASLTKLVTAMTFLDAKPNLDETVTMLPDDNSADGKTVFLAQDVFTKRELLQALLIGSINDAGNALARTTGGRDAFVQAMNRKARSLQMRQASFVDPTGLDPRNKSSARDVANALRAALLYPEIRSIANDERIVVKSRSKGKSYTIKSTNLLLSSFLNKPPFKIVAAKTGSLPEAGFCLAQATRDAQGHEIIAVVIGSDNHYSRFQDAKALTYWTFENYEWPREE